MQEIEGNLFNFISDPNTDSICITTNGIINVNGDAIMGKGIALTCKTRYPETPKILGACLKNGNYPYVIGIINNNFQYEAPNKQLINGKNYKCLIWSFPTKNDWKEKSDINLIAGSCKLMMQNANLLNLKKIILPRPGACNGKLNYLDEVKPIISKILDDRFYVCYM